MNEEGRGLATPVLRSDAVVSTLSQTRQAWRCLDRGDIDESTEVLAEQRRQADGDELAELIALTAAALIGALLGRLRQARLDLAAADRGLQALGVAGLRPHWEQAALVCDWMAGDWVAAEARSARLEAVPPAPPNLTLCLRAELLREIGRAEDAYGVVLRLQSLPGSTLGTWASSGSDPDPADALDRLQAVAAGPASGMLPLVLYRMARIAYELGDEQQLSTAAQRCAGLSRTDPLAVILADLSRALASRKTGPAKRAQDRADAQEMKPLGAEALAVQGLLGYQPERTLRAARDRWREIGADVRAAELSTLLGDRPAVVLSPRERELVGHVQHGRSNRDIAAAMHVSVKSVEAYLTRVYLKTGCASRVELAIAATDGRYPAARDAAS